jgi:hypothetical protein
MMAAGLIKEEQEKFLSMANRWQKDAQKKQWGSCITHSRNG